MSGPNPLLTILVDRKLIDLEPIKQLYLDGHKVITANLEQYDRIYSPKAMFLQAGLEGYVKLSLTAARREIRERKAKEKAEQPQAATRKRSGARASRERKSKDPVDRVVDSGSDPGSGPVVDPPGGNQ